jgi:hypothetical protein
MLARATTKSPKQILDRDIEEAERAIDSAVASLG